MKQVAVAVSRTVLVLSSFTALASAGVCDERVDGDANCKNGWEMIQDEENGIYGCYKGFPNKLNFAKAQDFCAARGGILAASRSKVEQDELVRLANAIAYGMKFWISGNSLALNGIWNWGYSRAGAVDDPPQCFRPVQFYNFEETQMSIIHSIPGGGNSDVAEWQGLALVNGHREGYSWKATPINGTGTTDIYGFVCRKSACPPDQDVVQSGGSQGMCDSSAVFFDPVKAASTAWITILVLGGIVLFLVLFWAYMHYFQNGHCILIKSHFTCCQTQSFDETVFLEMKSANPTRRKTIADLLVQHPLVPADGAGLEAGFGGDRRRSSAISGFSSIDQVVDLPQPFAASGGGSAAGRMAYGGPPAAGRESKTSLPPLMNMDLPAGGRQVSPSRSARLSTPVAIPESSGAPTGGGRAPLPPSSLGGGGPRMPKPSGMGGGRGSAATGGGRAAAPGHASAGLLPGVGGLPKGPGSRMPGAGPGTRMPGAGPGTRMPGAGPGTRMPGAGPVMAKPRSMNGPGSRMPKPPGGGGPGKIPKPPGGMPGGMGKPGGFGKGPGAGARFGGPPRPGGMKKPGMNDPFATPR